MFEELGFVVNLPAEQTRALRQEREIQEEVAVCMREQGYPYQPWYQPVPDSLASDGPVDPVKWAEVYGYGFMPTFSVGIETHPSARRDPNFVYIDGLTPEEATVYVATLQGVRGQGPLTPGVDEKLYADGGCMGRAFAAHNEDLEQQAISEQLYGEWLELEQRVNTDKAFEDYDASWSSCMAELGFSHESSPEASAYFQAAYDGIWASTEFPALTVDAEERRAMSSEERAALYDTQEPQYDHVRVERLAAEEIATAVADLKCQGDDPRKRLFIEVLRGYEDEFIAEHPSAVVTGS